MTKKKAPKDKVVALRMSDAEIERIKIFAQAESRTFANMLSVLVDIGIAEWEERKASEGKLRVGK